MELTSGQGVLDKVIDKIEGSNGVARLTAKASETFEPLFLGQPLGPQRGRSQPASAAHGPPARLLALGHGPGRARSR